MSSTPIPVRRALLSVSDKTGLIPFARALASSSVEILSTGGTANALKDAGIAVIDVSSHTGFPEIMDGRVKTLHPKIHGGLLARRDNAEHIQAMDNHGISGIDLLCVNLYPFAQTLESGADEETCIENIDIGGPAMIRAAAKNHAFVAVVTDPADYDSIIAEMSQNNGATTLSLRKKLATSAYAMTAAYDSAIAAWMGGNGDFGRHASFAGTLKQSMRYGENPHQPAALYLTGEKRPGAATARVIQGKELSYNNINDTDAAFELVAEFDRPAVVIVKHANPCGVAVDDSTAAAYDRALACDRVSAFGGIVALNRPLDAATASKIIEVFSEVIIAPKVERDALPILAAKKNIRVLETGGMPDARATRRLPRPVAGGLLVQDSDSRRAARDDLRIVTNRQPTDAEIDDMLFAFTVAKHVKSNAIVYASGLATLGIGAGQMSRVDSSRIAAHKMREMGLPPLPHLAVASDAFFPFADGMIAAAEAGATAIIQPGGSVRDAEVIAEADARGLTMAFTGIRHFRH